MADDVFFDVPTPTSPLVGGSFHLSLNGALPRSDNYISAISPNEAPPLPPKEPPPLPPKQSELAQSDQHVPPMYGIGPPSPGPPPLPPRDYPDLGASYSSRWADNISQMTDSMLADKVFIQHDF